jgi:hypothetical protein
MERGIKPKKSKINKTKGDSSLFRAMNNGQTAQTNREVRGFKRSHSSINHTNLKSWLLTNAPLLQCFLFLGEAVT